MVSWETVSLILAALLLFYTWMQHRYRYWARRGVAFIKPLPVVGNLLPAVTQKEPYAETLQKQYIELKPHKFGGTFSFMTPNLLITDPDLLRDITVKRFDHFEDKRTIANKADALVYNALVSLKGQEWRDMRNILSPAFTTSKLRAMFPLIMRCGEQFASFFINQPDPSNSPIEFKSTFTRFTNDVIATVAFGVECNSVKNKEEKFYVLGQKILDFKGIRLLIAIAYGLVPKLMELFKIPIMPRDVTSFFRDIIISTKKYREDNKYSRQDMLQLLMAAQKGGIEKEQGDEQYTGHIGEGMEAAEYYQKHLATEKTTNKIITDDDIAAQAFVFFIAGFETVSILLSFMSHELAVNPDLQKRLHEEIDSTILKDNGKLSYESIQSMKYLDMVISETLRKYPPAALSDRECTKDFKIPGTDVVIEKGTILTIPFFALHRDPEYFPEPERFDPERFNEENKKKIKPYTYLPFGSGPHNCIGMRLALLEAKVCIAYMLATCELRVCSKTEIPLQLSKKSFSMITDAGFWLLCVPRENPRIKIDN